MENDNDRKLGDELLKQNGIQAGTLSDNDRKTLHESIALGKKRVRRLKWVVAISWGVFFLGYPSMVMAVAFKLGEQYNTVHTLVVGLSLIVALVSTIALVIRGYSLRSRQMEDIRLGLRDIEAELKQLRES